MKTTLVANRPEGAQLLSNPTWWNANGDKMQIVEIDKAKPFLRIASNAAKLKISAHPIQVDRWYIDYEVRHSVEGGVRGRLYLTREEIEAAFGISQMSGDHGDSILEMFGGDSAEPGKFIRYQDFLNMPGPGTGELGDANISLLITNRIRQHIEYLLRK